MTGPRVNGTVRALSPREHEVVMLRAGGLKLREIAEKCGIQAKSVEAHLSNARNKLGFHTQRQLIEHARAQGWVS